MKDDKNTGSDLNQQKRTKKAAASPGKKARPKAETKPPKTEAKRPGPKAPKAEAPPGPQETPKTPEHLGDLFVATIEPIHLSFPKTKKYTKEQRENIAMLTNLCVEEYAWEPPLWVLWLVAVCGPTVTANREQLLDWMRDKLPLPKMDGDQVKD